MSDKRLIILENLESIIATEGYDKLSMAKLARLSNVAAGTIYRYFKDKEDLLMSLKKQLSTRYLRQISAGVKLTHCNYETFRQVWFNLLELHTQRNPKQLSIEQYLALPSEDPKQSLQLLEATLSEFDEFFRDGVENRILYPKDYQMLAIVSFAATANIGTRVRLGYTFDKDWLEQACFQAWTSIAINPKAV